MQQGTFRTHATRTPPPLWWVTNGDVTVGPCNTSLLVRGIRSGKVPQHCYVRDTRSVVWRRVTEVREVRAVGCWDAPVSNELAGLETLLRLTRDEEEALHLALEVASRKTHAVVGVAHWFENPRHPPITRFVRGNTTAQIGSQLSLGDPVTLMARNRSIAVGRGATTEPLTGSATRLFGRPDHVGGIAVLPIFGRRGIAGIVELGKDDLPFRSSDRGLLHMVAQSVSSQLRARS